MVRRKAASRAERRTRTREHRELVRELERLARAAPGGSPARPIAVESPAQIEPRVDGTPCPLCRGALRLEEHRAETIDGARLRVVVVRCTACGVRRALHFRLAAPPVN